MAAPILQVSGGILVGASGVSVNGILSDVEFYRRVVRDRVQTGVTQLAICLLLRRPRPMPHHKHFSIRCSWTAQADSSTRCLH